MELHAYSGCILYYIISVFIHMHSAVLDREAEAAVLKPMTTIGQLHIRTEEFNYL